MTTDTFHCEHPDHVGSRLVPNPLDRYSERLTFYRMDGKRRIHERTTRHLCRDCCEVEFRKETVAIQAAMFDA